jgi:hypothetical protein
MVFPINLFDKSPDGKMRLQQVYSVWFCENGLVINYTPKTYRGHMGYNLKISQQKKYKSYGWGCWQ